MRTKLYLEQLPLWPSSGRHILAQFDEQSIYVYQAYRPAIADYAVKNQCFGGEFSYSRMSWIKTNFLWMMYRSGWATKVGQERILAIKLKRHFFNEILNNVVPSTFDETKYDSQKSWQVAVANSEIRLQWDPDHDPTGRRVARRAVQIGLRGNALCRYGQSELLAIKDITSFVNEQRANIVGDMSNLFTVEEHVYYPGEEAAIAIKLNE